MKVLCKSTLSVATMSLAMIFAGCTPSGGGGASSEEEPAVVGTGVAGQGGGLRTTSGQQQAVDDAVPIEEVEGDIAANSQKDYPSGGAYNLTVTADGIFLSSESDEAMQKLSDLRVAFVPEDEPKTTCAESLSNPYFISGDEIAGLSLQPNSLYNVVICAPPGTTAGTNELEEFVEVGRTSLITPALTPAVKEAVATKEGTTEVTIDQNDNPPGTGYVAYTVNKDGDAQYLNEKESPQAQEEGFQESTPTESSEVVASIEKPETQPSEVAEEEVQIIPITDVIVDPVTKQTTITFENEADDGTEVKIIAVNSDGVWSGESISVAVRSEEKQTESSSEGSEDPTSLAQSPETPDLSTLEGKKAESKKKAEAIAQYTTEIDNYTKIINESRNKIDEHRKKLTLANADYKVLRIERRDLVRNTFNPAKKKVRQLTRQLAQLNRRMERAKRQDIKASYAATIKEKEAEKVIADKAFEAATASLSAKDKQVADQKEVVALHKANLATERNFYRTQRAERKAKHIERRDVNRAKRVLDKEIRKLERAAKITAQN